MFIVVFSRLYAVFIIKRKNESKHDLIRWQSVQRNIRGRKGLLESSRRRVSRTQRQEKNSKMDTPSRTKSVERPVRAVDLFIASLDALTLLEGSSTLSAQIDSDEREQRCWPLLAGWSAHSKMKIQRGRERELNARRG